MDRFLAALLLLPAFALAWSGPGAPLAGDLYPELTGAALAALALLPAAVMLVVRRAAPRVRGLSLLVLFFAVGALSLWKQPPSDTLEASRATLVALSALVALLGGASLGERGREALPGLDPIDEPVQQEEGGCALPLDGQAELVPTDVDHPDRGLAHANVITPWSMTTSPS